MSTHATQLLVHLEEGAFQTIRFTCFLDHKRISPTSAHMPSGLRSLARFLFSRVAIDDRLMDAFNEMEDFRIVFKTPMYGTPVYFDWDASFVAQSRVGISVSGDTVTLFSAMLDATGAPLPNTTLFGQQMVVDSDRFLVGKLLEKSGWRFMDVMAHQLPSHVKGRELKCPKSLFLTHCEWQSQSDLLESVVYTTVDRSVPLDVLEAVPVVSVVQDFDGFLLKLSYTQAGITVTPPSWKLVQSSATDRLYCMGFKDNLPVWVSSTFEVERHILAVLKEVLGDRFIPSDTDEGVFVAASHLSQVVSSLKERLAEFGTDVMLMDVPVASEAVEVSIEVNALDSGSFEVVPKFQIGREVYTGFDWISLLSPSGILQVGDKQHVLDPHSLRIIEQVLGVRDTQSKSKKGVDLIQFSRLEILDWMLLRQQGVHVRVPEAEEQILSRLTTLTELPDYPVPDTFKGDLRAYQNYGYRWLRFLYDCRFGACLADDMGLGKTIQALVFLDSLNSHRSNTEGGNSPSRPHLIVVPPSLTFNWVNEIKKFCPHFNIMVFNAKEADFDFESLDVLITTYDVLRRHSAWFYQHHFDVLVFDEAQYIKNLTAGRTKAARLIKRRFTLVLTGTPVENHLGEYFSIMDLVVPGIFGPYSVFQDFLKNGGVETLLRRTRPFVLRRTKREILKELPPMVETVDYLTMSPTQATMYRQILQESKRVVKSAFADSPVAQARIKVLTAILRLRQLCVSPGLLSKEFSGSSPKVDRLKELIQELYWEGHHVLVFSQFRSFLDILEPLLHEMKIDMVRMDGTTPVKKRGGIVEKFQSSESPMVFLLSLKTGGVGLNLTKANYVIHIDPWWNPAVEDQASSRAHRIGQTQSVLVNRLIMKDTIEERLMDLKAQKSKLFDDVVNFGGHSGGHLTKDDFDFLLSD